MAPRIPPAATASRAASALSLALGAARRFPLGIPNLPASGPHSRQSSDTAFVPHSRHVSDEASRSNHPQEGSHDASGNISGQGSHPGESFHSSNSRLPRPHSGHGTHPLHEAHSSNSRAHRPHSQQQQQHIPSNSRASMPLHSQQQQPSPSNSIPDLDWSFLRDSFASLPRVLIDMMVPERTADKAKRRGLRSPSPWLGFQWYSALPNVEASYRATIAARHRGGGDVINPGMLVKGIVYDMSALMVPVTSAGTSAATSAGEEEEGGQEAGGLSEREAEKLRIAELARTDWHSYVMGVDPSSSSRKDKKENKTKGGVTSSSEEEAETRAVTGGISLEELGDQSGVAAISDKIDKKRHIQLQQLQLQQENKSLNSEPFSSPEDAAASAATKAAGKRDREVQDLLAGARGDTIRAKYQGRIQERKMLAEARMERGGRGSLPGGLLAKAKKMTKDRTWLLLPHCSGILRHFQARLLHQSLLVTRPKKDLQELVDDVSSFEFRPVLQRDDVAKQYSLDDLYRICRDWNVNAKEVIVVLGTGGPAQSLLRELRGSPFFVCHIRTSGPLQVEASDWPASAATGPSAQEQVVQAVGEAPVPVPVGTDQMALETEQTAPSGPELPSGGSTPAQERWSAGLEGHDKVSTGGGAGKGGGGERMTHLEEILLWVMGRVVPGFRDVRYDQRRSRHVHFDAEDMRDLRRTVEDLNGVSYRSSTFVQSRD